VTLREQLEQFCYWQVTCKEDFEDGKQKSWTCSAHAIEERVHGCPYSSLKEAKEQRYPCVDAKPPETITKEKNREPSPQTREILKIIKNRPRSKDYHHPEEPTFFPMDNMMEFIEDLEEYIANFEFKLHACIEAASIHLSKDHVSREKLGKLFENRPKFTHWHETPPHVQVDKEEFMAFNKWLGQLELLTEKGGE